MYGWRERLPNAGRNPGLRPALGRRGRIHDAARYLLHICPKSLVHLLLEFDFLSMQ